MTDSLLNVSLAPADKAASYARVSTDFQEKKQISVPAQHRENREHIFKRDWLLGREFQDEGISGETLQRPGLQALLALAAEGALPENGAELTKRAVTKNAFLDVVVVWKLDRLTRPDDDDDLDFLLIRRDLRRCGVRIESVTEPWVAGACQVDGSSMDQFMGYLGRGQTKVEKITREARFDLGRRQIAEGQGRQNGPPPYGYDWLDPAGPDGAPLPRADVRRGRAWAPLEPAATWVRFIYAQYVAGESVNAITASLNARRAVCPSQSGDGGRRMAGVRVSSGEWFADSVITILKNRRYAGWAFHHKSGTWHKTTQEDGALKPGGHPALVSQDLWDAAQQIREGRGRRRAASSDALFAGGLLRCPRCAAGGRDTSMVVITRHHAKTLASGERKRYRWIAYGCFAAHKAQLRRSAGLPPDGLGCGNFEISQSKVLPLLLAYLRRLARSLTPADASRMQQLSEEKRAELLLPRGGEGARAAQAVQRAELEKQLAQIPLMETNFQMQQAQGLMTMDKLRDMLGGMAARAAALRAALAQLEDDKEDAQTSPLVAAYLLHLLEDDGATPLQKRDALNATFQKIVVGLDRQSLKVWLK